MKKFWLKIKNIRRKYDESLLFETLLLLRISSIISPNSPIASRRKSVPITSAEKSAPGDLAMITAATLSLNKDLQEIFRPHFYSYASLSISAIICFAYFISLS
jgi:hypothetical protein